MAVESGIKSKIPIREKFSVRGAVSSAWRDFLQRMLDTPEPVPYFYAFDDEDERDAFFVKYPFRLDEDIICVLTGTKYGLDFSEDDGDNTMYLPLLYP